MIGTSPLRTVAQERLTVDNTAAGIGLTKSKFITAPHVLAAAVYVETASIRYLADGSTPTASTGILAYPGDKIELNNPSEMNKFLSIRTGSTSATIQVVYLGR